MIPFCTSPLNKFISNNKHLPHLMVVTQQTVFFVVEPPLSKGDIHCLKRDYSMMPFCTASLNKLLSNNKCLPHLRVVTQQTVFIVVELPLSEVNICCLKRDYSMMPFCTTSLNKLLSNNKCLPRLRVVTQQTVFIVVELPLSEVNICCLK
jgi:hypothetical protein